MALRRGDPVWLHLAADERIVWESRPHLVAMGRGLPIGIGLGLLGLVIVGWSVTDGPSGAGSTTVSSLLTLLGIALAALGVVIALVRYAHWTNTRYVITSGELYKKRGIFSRDVTQFRLDRVQNSSLTQSMLGRLLGYGDLTIYTAGSGDPELVFECVPRPEEASRVLSGELVGSSADAEAAADVDQPSSL